MRIFDRRFLLMLVALASTACHKKSQSAEQFVAGAQAEGRVVECRVNGGDQFTRTCVLEWRRQSDGGNVLVLRHSDGGFRRIRVSADGHRVNQADGAEQMQMIGKFGPSIEIAIGDDHYRFTAHQLQAR